MRIIKLGHACVRLEHEDAVLVIDPGSFTDPGATDGATTVLITHEHADHWTTEQLRATRAPIVTIAAVADQIREQAPDVSERVRVVRPGEQLMAGLPVSVVGEKHAIIHPELPHFDNSGYLIEIDGRRVYHPGDALTAPGVPVDVLCAPVSAPWMKVSEGIEFARAVKAPHNLAIHDAIYSDAGLAVADGHFERFLGNDGLGYARLAAGQDLALD